MKNNILNELENYHLDLKNHQMYREIKNFNQLKIFMESHVFAVWDFMSLLKRLQNDLTCVEIPWRPSNASKETVRLINEIVLGEESDIGPNGIAIDHFSLYLKSMQEVGASEIRLINFLENFDYKYLNEAEKEFVQFNLNLAKNGKTHEVAAGFFYGREKLIPDMFTSLLRDLRSNLNNNTEYSNLVFYLERHIEVDGNEHGPLAMKCLNDLCGDDQNKWEEAISSGIQSLKLRIKLWDDVLSRL